MLLLPLLPVRVPLAKRNRGPRVGMDAQMRRIEPSATPRISR
jgi:hypothetical protein